MLSNDNIRTSVMKYVPHAGFCYPMRYISRDFSNLYQGHVTDIIRCFDFPGYNDLRVPDIRRILRLCTHTDQRHNIVFRLAGKSRFYKQILSTLTNPNAYLNWHNYARLLIGNNTGIMDAVDALYNYRPDVRSLINILGHLTTHTLQWFMTKNPEPADNCAFYTLKRIMHEALRLHVQSDSENPEFPYKDFIIWIRPLVDDEEIGYVCGPDLQIRTWFDCDADHRQVGSWFERTLIVTELIKRRDLDGLESFVTDPNFESWNALHLTDWDASFRFMLPHLFKHHPVFEDVEFCKKAMLLLNEYGFSETVDIFVLSGNVELLEWARERDMYANCVGGIDIAAYLGNREVMDWIFETNRSANRIHNDPVNEDLDEDPDDEPEDSAPFMKRAAELYSIVYDVWVLDWVISKGLDLDDSGSSLACIACELRHPELAQWAIHRELKREGEELIKTLRDMAIEGGNYSILDIVKSALTWERGVELTLCEFRNANFHVIYWFHSKALISTTEETVFNERYGQMPDYWKKYMRNILDKC
jgi:hypothetical protein